MFSHQIPSLKTLQQDNTDVFDQLNELLKILKKHLALDHSLLQFLVSGEPLMRHPDYDSLYLQNKQQELSLYQSISKTKENMPLDVPTLDRFYLRVYQQFDNYIARFRNVKQLTTLVGSIPPPIKPLQQLFSDYKAQLNQQGSPSVILLIKGVIDIHHSFKMSTLKKEYLHLKSTDPIMADVCRGVYNSHLKIRAVFKEKIFQYQKNNYSGSINFENIQKTSMPEITSNTNLPAMPSVSAPPTTSMFGVLPTLTPEKGTIQATTKQNNGYMQTMHIGEIRGRLLQPNKSKGDMTEDPRTVKPKCHHCSSMLILLDLENINGIHNVASVSILIEQMLRMNVKNSEERENFRKKKQKMDRREQYKKLQEKKARAEAIKSSNTNHNILRAREVISSVSKYSENHTPAILTPILKHNDSAKSDMTSPRNMQDKSSPGIVAEKNLTKFRVAKSLVMHAFGNHSNKTIDRKIGTNMKKFADRVNRSDEVEELEEKKEFLQSMIYQEKINAPIEYPTYSHNFTTSHTRAQSMIEHELLKIKQSVAFPRISRR